MVIENIIKNEAKKAIEAIQTEKKIENGHIIMIILIEQKNNEYTQSEKKHENGVFIMRMVS